MNIWRFFRVLSYALFCVLIFPIVAKVTENSELVQKKELSDSWLPDLINTISLLNDSKTILSNQIKENPSVEIMEKLNNKINTLTKLFLAFGNETNVWHQLFQKSFQTLDETVDNLDSLINILMPRDIEYRFKIVTGKADGAGTGAKIYIELYGDYVQTLPISLEHVKYDDDKEYKDHFKSGAVASFSVNGRDVGKISKLHLFSDGGADGWFCQEIMVDIPERNDSYHFTANVWMDLENAMSFHLIPDSE